MSPRLSGVICSGVFFIACLGAVCAEWQGAEVLVKSVHGRGSYCVDKMNWLPLAPNVTLRQGAVLRTDGNSTADVVMNSSGTALRLIPSTLLEVKQLDKEVAGEEVITRTLLELRAGGLIGSQRKLERPSTFQIQTRAGTVNIGRTKYLVLADGTVRCVAGSLWVASNIEGNVEPEIAVPAGFSFDPGTGALAGIEPAILTTMVADVDAVHQNAKSLKMGSGLAVTRLEDRKVSPTTGNNGVGNGSGGGQPPGNPPPNNGPGTGPGNPGNKGGTPGHNG